MENLVEIKVTQVFNGEIAGKGEVIYYVEPARFGAFVAARAGAGEGWGNHFAVASEADAHALGAWQTDYDNWFVDVGPDSDPLPLGIDPSGPYTP